MPAEPSPPRPEAPAQPPPRSPQLAAAPIAEPVVAPQDEPVPDRDEPEPPKEPAEPDADENEVVHLRVGPLPNGGPEAPSGHFPPVRMMVIAALIAITVSVGASRLRL
ncbi:hypothetical protein NORO109296_25730 [Nocardiopsis rhodophaea]